MLQARNNGILDVAISADTQSALLLCAPLWKRAKDGPAPLTPSEYNQLAGALHAQGYRPGSLLETNASAVLPSLIEQFPEKMRERVTRERILRLLERGGQLALALSHWSSAGIWVVSRADTGYPSRYKRKLGRAAPPVVYGIGPASLLESGGLAVVGSRKPDESSIQYTTRVGMWAAAANVQIISGAARGVDEGAMLSCVQAGGTALGVVAESLLKLSTRKDFREAIMAGKCALISSFDPDAGFTVPNAMARNRWIYALADRALVVASSDGRGGTWAGALEAMKHGETVFVRTGHSERPGNEALIARGALRAPDSLNELWSGDIASAATPPAAAPSLLQAEDAFSLVAPLLLQLLRDPLSAQQLAKAAGLTKSQAEIWMKRLLVEGRIERLKTKYHVIQAKQEQPNLFSSTS